MNSDPEFQIAAKGWNAAIRVTIGAQMIVLKITNGTVERIFEPDPTSPDFLIETHEYDLQISGPEREWANVFVEVPRPFYHELFAMTTRHEFDWGGNVKMWFAYYPALSRMITVMRQYAAIGQEA